MLALILAALSVLGTLPTGQSQSSWNTFTSSEGRFSANMPGEVMTNTIITNTKEGRLLTHMTSPTDQNLNEFMVSWTEYPDQKSIEQRGNDRNFDRVRDAFARTRDLTVFQETSLTTSSYPGRTFSMKTSDGGRIVRMQVYFVKNRFYQINADTRAVDSSDGEKFLNSFKLLPGTLI